MSEFPKTNKSPFKEFERRFLYTGNLSVLDVQVLKEDLIKCDLTYEGTERDYFWRDDHYEGKMIFSILREEFEESH